MTPQTSDHVAEDDHRAVSLVVEIMDAREGGNTRSRAGNSDDDLLYAATEARDALDRIVRSLEAA